MSDYYMLGDLISQEKGKITSQRVLDVEGGEPLATRTGPNKKAKRIKYY